MLGHKLIVRPLLAFFILSYAIFAKRKEFRNLLQNLLRIDARTVENETKIDAFLPFVKLSNFFCLNLHTISGKHFHGFLGKMVSQFSIEMY